MSAAVVAGVALLFGFGALAYGFAVFTEADVPGFVSNWGKPLENPLAFWRVGHMHNFSYLGGGAGALVGLSFMIWCGGCERKRHS